MFRRAAGSAVSSEVGIPPLTLHSPSRTSPTIRSRARKRPTTAFPLLDTTSRRIRAPSTLPARGIHFPVRRVPPGAAAGSHRRSARSPPPRLTLRWVAVPRRGGPIPLRSACAVSHDLGGLLLLGPGGVFHPLTSLGFGARLPDASLRSKVRRPTSRGSTTWCVPRCDPCDARGARFHPEGSWPVTPRTAAETTTQDRHHRSQLRRVGSGSSSPHRLQAVSGT